MLRLSNQLYKGPRSILESSLLSYIKKGNVRAAADTLVSAISTESATIQQSSLALSSMMPIPAITPNLAALVLHACDTASQIDEAKLLITKLSNLKTFVWDSKLASLVIRIQSKSGDLDGAAQTFAWLVARGEVKHRSWSPYVHGVAASIVDLCSTKDERSTKSSIELLTARLTTLAYLLDVSTQFLIPIEEDDFMTILSAYANVSAKGPPNAAPLSLLHQLLLLVQPHVTVVNNGVQLKQYLGQWAGTMMKETTLRPVHSGNDKCSIFSAVRGAECPSCGTQLVGHPYSSALRSALLASFHSTVIPNVSKSSRAPQLFEAFTKYIHTRGDANVYIDGANVGYYGLSNWYGVAKRKMLAAAGNSEEMISRLERQQPQDFVWDAKKRFVDVPPSFELIDIVLTELATNPKYAHYNFRPLIFLHRRHTEEQNLLPENKEYLNRWLQKGLVYCSPDGINDDLCWLYSSFYHTIPTDTLPGTEELNGPRQKQVYIVTGDLMRDHIFALFDRKTLSEFRDRARIGFSCQFLDGKPSITFKFPRPFATCMQFDSKTLAWHIPMLTSQAHETGELEDDKDANVEWLCLR